MRGKTPDWAELVIAAVGQPLPNGLVLIPYSRRGLTEVTDVSAGTVQHHVKRLCRAGIASSERNRLVIDPRRLRDSSVQKGSERSPRQDCGQTTDENRSRTTLQLPSETSDQATTRPAKETAGLEPAGSGLAGRLVHAYVLLLELFPTVVDLMAQTNPENGDLAARTKRANETREVRAPGAEPRELHDESSREVQEKEEIDSSFSLSSARTSRVDALSSDESRKPGAAVIAQETVDRLLDPLRDLCRKRSLICELNPRGYGFLRELTEEQLEAGVKRTCEKVRGETLTMPLGWLVKMVMKNEGWYFAAPTPLPPASSPAPLLETGDNLEQDSEIDLVAEEAIVAMSDVERDELDAVVLDQMALPDRVKRGSAMFAAQRRVVWRQRNSSEVA